MTQKSLKQKQYKGWLDSDVDDTISYREHVSDEKGSYSKWAQHPRANVMTKSERKHHRGNQGTRRTSLQAMETYSELWRRHYSKFKTHGWSPGGEKGTDIKSLQSRLSRLGYDLGPTGVDETWGDYTDKAYKEYERDWFQGFATEEIIKKNTYNKKVKDFLKKRQNSVEDKLIDSMKSKSNY
jgi:hypothetical protein